MDDAISREINSFPIRQNVKAKLIASGFRAAEDFIGLKPVELAKEAQISIDDALDVINFVLGRGSSEEEALIDDATRDSNHNTSGGTAATSNSNNNYHTTTNRTNINNTDVEGKTALEMLQKHHKQRRIVTFCKAIDDMLGGGVSTGTITEFCGVPGIGKTQLGIQLAVDVQIPTFFAGAEGQAIYIDTEGSYMVERVEEVARALVTHLQRMAAARGAQEQIDAVVNFSVDQILSNIYYYRVHDFIEQLALVNVLSDFLSTHPQVRLIVIDSITSHFRHDFDDMAKRSRLLHGLAQKLSEIASQHDVAVVLMNQVTTKISEKEAYLAPALGESWAHASPNRIILYWKDTQRYAYLYKSPQLKQQTVPYDVTSEGVRDVNRKRTRVDGASYSNSNSNE